MSGVGPTCGPGHNGGPTMEPGFGWRKHCWSKARQDLLPHLPIEILRNRVRRAKELGLEYRTYASVRAATGHDVVGFLFSSNALRVLKARADLPVDRAEKLSAIEGALRLGLAQAPLTPEALRDAARMLEDVQPAPRALASWREQRESLRAALAPSRLSGDQVLLIGDLTLERDWCAAAGLAGYLPAERYFAA